MLATSLVNLAPLAQMALLGCLIALGPLVWVWARHRGADAAGKRRALTLLTLFLTFDLVLFGAFTRLTDSGLGCPDWPGCYGSASPLGAAEEIHAAQSAQPSGPVTQRKAWIEMVHRYLATAVGVLITVGMVLEWLAWRRERRERHGPRTAAPGWATLTFVWVCVQGAFGALTVTLKLYPAIVTAHLLGGMVLLALLAAQASAVHRDSIPVTRGLRLGLALVALLTAGQIALGGWVSTNYAVLACTGFPTCQGQWWPSGMDWEHGFSILRPLGAGMGGEGYLPFGALVAIHMVHRVGALILLPLLVALGLMLWRTRAASLRPFALGLWGVALWQSASGISNVVLGWPLAAAVAHTAGAAALVVLLTTLWVRVGVAAPAIAGRPAVAPVEPRLARR
ncbi:COX15/CtaA family protein [Rivibacter subsaxonicus]|uniref:Cytochrome c oxidase assembly protein subunit 15 n=1 Tax=Rivibacter subsaxonicus TaxID=457575 RepID=A0A4Q7VGN3_9BURK|nr:COX15/CtaA family protein [Rivibacter subsaxonicus]RZT95206.1 cytochrome c oxidase assembly protein subunit 15 [Rivibacter subsaxonicus]